MKKNIFITLLIVIVSTTLFAQNRTHEQAMEWWRNARFGMFIHWGPVTLRGTEIGWSRGNEVPIEEYDNLYKRFNPVNFNADEWAGVAKAAGMKYIVLTTKHHDGFCLWNTRQTDYNIMNTPFKRDVVKELAAACKKQEIAFGTYYSTLDWHHPDFPFTSPAGQVKRPVSNIDAYTSYLKRQVAELLVNYGPLLLMWFDMPQGFDEVRGKAVIDFVRSIQPDLIVNDRTGAEGDYSTPEQKVGEMQMDRPWETCMTIGNQWSWKKDDNVKSLKKCLEALILSAAGDGNLLFNVGPSPLGVIEPLQVQRLKEMGAWLQKHGEAIYGTRGGPFLPGQNIASTRKDKNIYLFIFRKNSNISLPPIPTKILSASLLNGTPIEFRQTPENTSLTIPSSGRDSIATIVKITLDKPAIEMPLIDLKDDYIVKVSNYRGTNSRYAGSMLVDGSIDPLSRWQIDDNVKRAWAEIDYRKIKSIDRITLYEMWWQSYHRRIYRSTRKKIHAFL